MNIDIFSCRRLPLPLRRRLADEPAAPILRGWAIQFKRTGVFRCDAGQESVAHNYFMNRKPTKAQGCQQIRRWKDFPATGQHAKNPLFL
jgi:hypothetical protein